MLLTQGLPNMPGPCYSGVVPDPDTYLESRGYRMHVSEEEDGWGVEECVYKACALGEERTCTWSWATAHILFGLSSVETITLH